MDNIDNDVFRDALEGGDYGPCDETVTAVKCAAYSLVVEAYDKNLVRPVHVASKQFTSQSRKGASFFPFTLHKVSSVQSSH